MRKEVLIYGQIDSYSSSEFIEDVNEILENDSSAELTARLNTNGGEVEYAWGIITKFAEYPNEKSVIIDGKAQSMGLYFCCYTDNVTSADFANFLLHRASYPFWIENDPSYFTEARKNSLALTNKKLRQALEAKIDVAKFEKLKKVTLDQVFSMEGVLDVPLTAQEAKQIGLINKIIQVTPQKKAEVEAKTIEISAKHNGITIAAKTNEITNTKKNKMTLSELKTDHPALYAEVVNIGVAQGATQEKERIEAWAHFVDIDAKAVKEGIASGKVMTQLQIIELSEKKFSSKAIEEIEKDSQGNPINTKQPNGAKSEAEKKAEAIAEWKKEVLANSEVLKEVKVK